MVNTTIARTCSGESGVVGLTVAPTNIGMPGVASPAMVYANHGASYLVNPNVALPDTGESYVAGTVVGHAHSGSSNVANLHMASANGGFYCVVWRHTCAIAIAMMGFAMVAIPVWCGVHYRGGWRHWREWLGPIMALLVCVFPKLLSPRGLMAVPAMAERLVLAMIAFVWVAPATAVLSGYGNSHSPFRHVSRGGKTCIRHFVSAKPCCLRHVFRMVFGWR